MAMEPQRLGLSLLPFLMLPPLTARGVSQIPGEDCDGVHPPDWTSSSLSWESCGQWSDSPSLPSPALSTMLETSGGIACIAWYSLGQHCVTGLGGLFTSLSLLSITHESKLCKLIQQPPVKDCTEQHCGLDIGFYTETQQNSWFLMAFCHCLVSFSSCSILKCQDLSWHYHLNPLALVFKLWSFFSPSLCVLNSFLCPPQRFHCPIAYPEIHTLPKAKRPGHVLDLLFLVLFVVPTFSLSPP